MSKQGYRGFDQSENSLTLGGTWSSLDFRSFGATVLTLCLRLARYFYLLLFHAPSNSNPVLFPRGSLAGCCTSQGQKVPSSVWNRDALPCSSSPALVARRWGTYTWHDPQLPPYDRLTQPYPHPYLWLPPPPCSQSPWRCASSVSPSPPFLRAMRVPRHEVYTGCVSACYVIAHYNIVSRFCTI